MTVGEISALVAAGAAVVLVVFAAVALTKLGRTMDEATTAIREARKSSVPLLNDADTAIKQVNTQLERVDGITAGARAVTSNVSVLTSLFTATLGGPLVRTAAFSYGILPRDQGSAQRAQGPIRHAASPVAQAGRSVTKRRLFWLGIGLAIGSVLAQRMNQAAERFSSGPVSRGLGQRLRNLAAGLGEFGAEFSVSRRHKERQLTQMVESKTGIPLPTIGGTLFPDAPRRPRSDGTPSGSVVYGPGAVPPDGSAASRAQAARRARPN